MQTAQFIGKEKIQAGLVDPTTISLVQKKGEKNKSVRRNFTRQKMANGNQTRTPLEYEYSIK